MDRIGKYQLVRKLATGGMAEVFLARAEGPGGFSKKLVVKRILPHFVSDPTFAAMFLSEARLAAELNHPNVVQIFDFGQTDGQYYLAMEYIDGANLRILNAAAIERGGRVPFPVSARLISQAAEGLHFAHQLAGDDGKLRGLIHRDISPDNIIVSRTGAVKVLDFGIAKENTQPTMTKSGVIKGKMAYMPPEQLGRKPLDRRVDIFALGVVLHELVTGLWPFDASSEVSIIQAIMNEEPFVRVRERKSDVPEALDAIVAKCLEKNRELRYADCKELQADLERYISSTGEQVYPADLADLVNQLVPPSPNADISQPVAASELGLDRTFRRDVPEDALARTDASGVSAVPVAAAATPAPVSEVKAPRSMVPMIAVGATAAAAVVAGVIFFLQPPPPVTPVPPPHIEQPPVLAVVDAGAPEVPDAGAAAVVVAPTVIDAGVAEAPVVDAGSVKPANPHAGKGEIEFRVRPEATVYLDGKLMGETPIAKSWVPVGKHHVKLVNEKYKNYEGEFSVKPGPDNIFKYNFKE